MNKSLIKNSIFYMIYNILNMLFPFFTNMYVARVLLPSSIGEVAYAQNIVSYFSILAFLGIPTYGVREIAKVRYKKEELSSAFSELLIINFISTLFFSIIYYALIFIASSFRENRILYSVVGITIILNMLNVSWLYEGLEEFGFISLRNAVFKIVMFGLVLLVVKKEQDILSYAAISVFGVAGNNIINIIHANKYIYFKINNLNFQRHLKSIFILAVVNLAIEIYTLVDTTMLGIMSTKEHVAYYYYASKVNKILLQITNTITIVLVPRISLYYKEQRMDEFNRLLTKALKIIIIGAVPIIIGLQFTSSFLFSHFFGNAYISSALVERILCTVLVISPIGYLLGSRVMLVSNNESKMATCVCIGAIINLIGNFILIHQFNEVGAALASVISEIVIMIIYIYQGKNVYKLNEYKSTILKVSVASMSEIIILFICNLFSESWGKLIIEIFLASCIYVTTLILLKESIVKEFLLMILKKIKQIK